MLNFSERASKTGKPVFGTAGEAQNLAALLANAKAELDRLQNITRPAGYTIIFRDRSGAIVDHTDNASRPPARGGLKPSAIQRVRDYVEAHLESRIEISDLAARANLSRCYFAYAFKRSLGCTPHRYVMSRRLERARQLLCDEALPISEIACATGFADQSHLSRCFRANFSISPLAYRRSRR